MQKHKVISEEALRIAEKRREVKGKGENGRYICVNAEFQRTARRDKKAFLNEQCKEIEENNRRCPSCKNGHSKGWKQYEHTEAEDIKKRWQKINRRTIQK